MGEFAFTSRLTTRDVLKVSAYLLLRHRLSVFALAAGPVLWISGMLGGAEPVTRLGVALAPLAVGLPLFALLVGSYAAYRPGASELYAPVTWAFTEDGIDIAHTGRRARAEWTEFRSWRTCGGCYLLDVTRSRYLSIPVRDVPAADRTGFEDLCTAKLGARRR
jgi:hypothetical protein